MKFNRKTLQISLVTLGMLIESAYAGPPMGFKDAAMVMGESSSSTKDWMVNYSFTPADAVGVGYHLWKGDGKVPGMRVEHSGVSYTRLLQRWNTPGSQANIWFGVDAGSVTDALNFSGTKFGVMPSIQADWETTRLYALAFASTLRMRGGPQYDTFKAQAGFSFFEAEYDEWQPWLVVEVKHMPGMYAKPEVTPFLRVISNSLYIELGANLQGKPRVGLMKVIHF
jgi:hypothetical protein